LRIDNKNASFTGVIALTLLALAAWALWTPDLARTALEQRYLQAPSDMVQVLDTRLHVRQSGPKDAPAVLLLHGFGSSLETWETWTPALSAGLRVLRIDLPGNGLSPPDSRLDYSDTRSIALISALLDARGIQKTHVLGLKLCRNQTGGCGLGVLPKRLRR